MKKFTNISSQAVPIPMEDIDTDQIIPARFLKSTSRAGFGANLFRDWRYDQNDQPKKDFVLNNDTYSGSILVCGKNFGCGSSREHAAWALDDYGFRVVVSSFFADIFKNNALNNGLLPITVSQEQLHTIFKIIESDAAATFDVSLINQKFTCPSEQLTIDFSIDPFKKTCLLEGMDTIDFLISKRETIREFESRHLVY